MPQSDQHLPYAVKCDGLAGEGGGSCAVLLSFSDGVKRVTKLRENPQGNIVLANELITARLADRLKAPCPQGEIVSLTDAVLADIKVVATSLDKALPGPAFGSRWYPGNYSPGPDICQTAANRADLAGLVVLYTWTRNSDLKDAHLLYSAAKATGTHQVWGVDHGHCFEANWDESIANKATDVPVRSLATLDTVIAAADFGPFLARLEAVGSQNIQESMDGVPAEWGIPKAGLDALGNYLIGAIPTVVATIAATYLKDGGSSA